MVLVASRRLYTIFFSIISLALVSQTIDIESYEPLGKPSQQNPSNLRGPGPGTVVVQNGNGTLGQIYTQSKCGLNYAAASQRIGQRFSPAGVAQPAPFAIAGIPAGSVIEKAYLWAGGSGNGAAQTATVSGPAGTFNYPMTIVGSGADVCWSYSGTYNYRADVTTAVNGNGTYNISGLLVTGPTSGNDMSGATLMVIYSNSAASWAGNITISDGAIVVAGGNANYTQPLTAICGTPTSGRAFSIIDDIQTNAFTQTLNGTAAPGSWNWWNYFDVGTTFTTGQTSSALSMANSGDCYAVMAYGTYYQNSNCISCSSLTVTTTPPVCGQCNGSASVTVSPPGSYTYTWSPSGGNAATAGGLCAGNYTVSVQSGATIKTQTFALVSTSPTITAAVSQTSVSCFGACTAAATLTPSGGTAPYSYTWSPSGGNSSSAGSLCAGTYSVIVKDANTCSMTKTLSITQPSSLTATTSQTNVLCNGGSTGSASVAVSGGTGAYSYTWSPSGGNAATATGLAAGNYTVTVNDANNCSTTKTLTITQPVVLSSVTSQTNVLCNGGATGTASVTVSGGTGAYTYTWSPSGGNAASATGLTAGTYTVAIKDANNCNASNTVTITQPTSLTAVSSQTNVACNGGASGSASVSASGGTGAYSYTWSPSGGNASLATGLTAGNYTVAIRDANNCSITKTLTITQPTSFTISATTSSVLCFGGTGSATVSVSGGTGGYSYTWTPSGGNGANASGLTAGNYSIAIADANNCPATKTVTITQPASVTATSTQTNISCYGGSNGTASVTASGGTGPYTYTWSPSGGNAASATALGPGNYTVAIRDVNGCLKTQTLTITQPSSLTPVTSQTNSTCGSSNGSASVSVTGGTGAYSYTWSPSGGNAALATSLAPGSYTVNIKDANNCTANATVNITQTAQFTLTASHTNVTCNGTSNGSGTVTVTGGTAPYSYTWSPSGGNAATATGLAAGNYTISIRDAIGCTTSTLITITQPASLTAVTSQTNILCNGASTGAASITVSGGTSPYTYTWSPTGGNTLTATGLNAGTYSVAVSDANSCPLTRTLTITQPTALSATVTHTDVSCNGSANGMANASVSGGVSPYTYTWSPTGGNSASATGLSAGDYTVLVQDANLCQLTRTVNIAEPGQFTITVGSSSVSCFGQSTGSGTVNVSGGTTPYSYTWSPSGGNNAVATGLSAGTYSVAIRDVNGCSSTKTISVTQPTSLTASTTQTNVGCFGQNTGAAQVSANGATAPYTYTWNPSGGNASLETALNSGNYTVTINDANGCVLSKTVTVTQPTSLTATGTQTNLSCNNSANGSASVSISGGTSPYTYTWSPVTGSASMATGLQAGTYTVSASDANNCPVSQTYTITQPLVLSATGTQTNVTCNGLSNGQISSSVTGGTAPYSYTWSPSGGNGSNATGLPAGSYTLTARDANNCTVTYTALITEPAVLTAALTQTNVSCNSLSNGSASVTAGGGTFPYSYTWTPSGGNASLASGLAAGNYSVTISDANLCSLTSTLQITQPTSYTVTVNTTSVACNGQSTGTASVNVSGATGPYTYTWNPTGGNSSTASGLAAGNYSIAIEDANLCPVTATLNITEPTALTAILTHTDVSCNGASNGVANVSVFGGVSPYTYTWSPSGGNSSTASGLSSGTYSVLVADANTCQLSATVTVDEASQYTITAATTSISCFGLSNGSATLNVSGGVTPYSYTWSPSGGNAATAGGLSAGTYSVLISDANSCGKTFTLEILQPTLLTAVASQTNSTCYGSNNGAAMVTASGGTTPYTYSWTPASSSNSVVTSLAPGIYSVTVSDANLCSLTRTVTITEPSQYTISAATTSVLCNGQSTGSATVSVSGNTSPYTYTWSPAGGNSSTAGALATGAYTVAILDANNCAATQTLYIAQPAALTGTAASSAANCNNADGSATVTVTGGEAPYSYTWSPAGGNAAVTTGIATGSYTCSIRDLNNCALSLTTSVAVINPSVTLAATNYSICNGANTSLFANGSNTYTWSPAGSLSAPTGSMVTASPTITTTYTATGANAYGCTVTNTISIYVYPNPVIVTSVSSNSICAGKSTTLTASGASTYTWSPATGLNNTNSSSPVATLSNSVSYTVVATNSLGCTGTQTIDITVQALPTVSATANSATLCLHETSTLTATGASTYTWSPNHVGSTYTVSPATSTVYTVSGKDANGCLNSGTVAVTVNQPPVVSISSATVICNGQTATLTANGASTYSWNTGASSAAINVSPSGTTSYTVIGTNTKGCKDTASFTLAVLITPTLTITGPNQLCSGDQITLTASGGSNGYIWSTGDNTSSISYVFTSGAVLTVTSGTSPCTASASHTLLVNPLPVVSAVASPTDIIIGQSSQLTAAGGGQYQWLPDESLSCNTCANPVAQPTASTIYTVEVTNSNGCKNYTTVLVNVDIICGELFAPSAFSPNGDGHNDTWTVYGNCIETIQCDIFNRWGQKVYSITQKGDAWDGTLNGVAQNPGVFIYQVNATFINGDAKSQKGNFTLVK